jgi:hypothetical protein
MHTNEYPGIRRYTKEHKGIQRNTKQHDMNSIAQLRIEHGWDLGWLAG